MTNAASESRRLAVIHGSIREIAREPMNALDELTNLYLSWRAVVTSRSMLGELRVSQTEADALASFVAALETLPEDLHPLWTAARAALESADSATRCACGHALSHHDERGSCFHVIGCATTCDCGGPLAR